MDKSAPSANRESQPDMLQAEELWTDALHPEWFGNKTISLEPERYTINKRVAAIVILLLIIASAGIMAIRSSAPPKAAPRQVTATAFPAVLDRNITGSKWSEPADIAIAGDSGYVIDPGTNTIYAVDFADKKVRDISLTEELAFPMAIDIYKKVPYIADSEASRIATVHNGRVVGIKLPPGTAPARPTGIHIMKSGNILVADGNNNRVLEVRPSGRVVRMIGGGERVSANRGFNMPGGITTDEYGNIYIVDILNARVQKFSSDGMYLSTYGNPDNTSGPLKRPKDVAVDRRGNVYVSDGLQSAISVFSAEGKYLGFIGRTIQGDKSPKSLFKAISGIGIKGDKLYVVDRVKGVFIFKLPA